MEKKFCEVIFRSWIVNKLEPWIVAASVNTAYEFEFVKETEKAVQLHIFNPKDKLNNGFNKWLPKSSIENLGWVLAK